MDNGRIFSSCARVSLRACVSRRRGKDLLYDEYRIPPLNLPRKITLHAIFEAKYPSRLMRTRTILFHSSNGPFTCKMQENEKEKRRRRRGGKVKK